MGCSSSKNARNSIRTEMSATQSNSGQDETPVPKSSNRCMISKKGVPIDSVEVQKRAKQWKIIRRFSNGASSQGTQDDNSSNKKIDIASAKPTSKSSLRKSLNRQISDGSCLDELRETLEKDGDLAKTVVRIETPFDTPIEEIYDGVLDGKILGTGISGTVRRIVHRVTGINYAVKCLDLSLIDTEEGLVQLRNEILIMCQLDHPNVMRIEEVYESNNEIYIVQELCEGGDLFDRLDQQPNCHYTEEQCALLVKQMLSSVRYLHSKGIIHRDLKLENFLFSTPNEESDLKLIDFGLSKHFEIGQHHCEKVGTPYTVAPEILKGNYNEKSDIWSLGVITFLLLCGETPFGGLDGENMQIVKQNILRAQVKFEPKKAWEHVSEAGKSFVGTLLDPDSSKRPTAKEAQHCKWIQEWTNRGIKEGNSLHPKTIGALTNFKESSEMQRLLSEVLSFTLLPEQMVDLRKEFEKLDSNGDGEITLVSLKRILIGNPEIGTFGSLSEQDVEEIFESVKLPVRKGESTIRWHEFLAACLSRAEIDDRNLRLAFDRLDADRKGFITVDDLSGILGNNTDSEALRKVWKDSLVELKVHNVDRITLHEFKSIMKGRPKDGVPGFMQFNPALLASFLIEQMFSKCQIYDQDFFPLLGDPVE